MRTLILYVHVIAASSTLPIVIGVFIRQLVTRRAAPRARKISAAVFGVGFSSGIWLSIYAASLPKTCAMLAAYAAAFALFFGFLWGEDPADCPYMNEQQQ